MLTLSCLQLNPWVGHLSYNLEKITAFYQKTCAENKHLAVLPECALTGYPLEDLVLKPHFMEKVESAVNTLKSLTKNTKTALLLGAPWKINGKLYNSALLLQEGSIKHIICKQSLPNYGVFDEKRLYTAAESATPFTLNGVRVGVLICEDMWVKEPTQTLFQQGVDLLLVLNGSPFDATKDAKRKEQAVARVKDSKAPLVYLNLMGGQDSLVFDGHSFVMNEHGQIVYQHAPFAETDFSISVKKSSLTVPESAVNTQASTEALTYQALVKSLQDYVARNGFKGVLLGLSGGIDSAISAAVAVDALGADKVHCVMMPSPYTSSESLEDAAIIVNMLGISYQTLPITSIMETFTDLLKESFSHTKADITEENIQSRARGMILMALSNKLGLMVLSTGNKSEVAVGYATLYGDMCGGFNVLKDVYKTQVFALSRWRNQNWLSSFRGPKGFVMPERVITKPPSAELRPDQKDQDSLPSYDELDFILNALIERDLSPEEIVSQSSSALETVLKVCRLLDRAEYKRRQACPGPKITERALSFERRYPITNGYILNL